MKRGLPDTEKVMGAVCAACFALCGLLTWTAIKIARTPNPQEETS